MLLSFLAASAALSAVVVKVELTVSAEGAVTDCAVVESNAPPELADETCRVSMSRVRQVASRDASGTPVESKKVVTVRYQIPAPSSAG
jgi:hypothetical protein